MESIYCALPLSMAPQISIDGIVLSQEQRDALALRINEVILERKRVAKKRRMLARLRQLQSLERSQERSRMLRED